MRVVVDRSEAGLRASLRGRDEFTELSVCLGQGVAVAAGDATPDGGVRFRSAEQAEIDEQWLRSAGRFDERPDASEAFGRMLDYAADHGWIEAETGSVLAHVEPAGGR